MASTSKTVIVTGGSQGIRIRAVQAFLDRDYNVVAIRAMSPSRKTCHRREKLALVDGDIGEATTAARVAETAISTFARLMHLNNAGIFFTEPFIHYTAEDFKRSFHQ